MDVAVVGAAGYAGVELLRLLLGHPEFEPVLVTSASDAGRRVDEVYPILAGCTDLRFSEPDPARISAAAEVAFLAVPHTAAMALAPALLSAGQLVVDASADFRLRDPGLYERWYQVAHTAPELIGRAVYGLPELGRDELCGAELIACPGCYPTAALLAAAPAFAAGLVVGDRVIVDAKSGISGAGRSATQASHFPVVNESVSAYKVGAHRHTPEMVQEMSKVAGRPVRVTFTPHLAPMTRGLLATVYLEPAQGVDGDTVIEAYRDRYFEEPFVTVHPDGVMPSTAEVRGTNRAHLGVVSDPSSGMLVVACAIDNLVKGTAGQAIQCANLASGLPETAGLTSPVPVV